MCLSVVAFTMDPVALVSSLIDAVKDLIHYVKEFGLAIKEISDPSLATNPLTFPAGAVSRYRYLSTKAQDLVDAMIAIFNTVAGIIP